MLGELIRAKEQTPVEASQEGDAKRKRRKEMAEVERVGQEVEDMKGFFFFRKALEKKNEEVNALKKENYGLKREFRELKEESGVGVLKQTQKRLSNAVTSSSPQEQPAAAKQKPDPSATTTMYTPKDMETLRRPYKNAVEGKYVA
ncbi:hypothetical protein CBR_g51259 [Chara braunii]|uniref:Uncharacterized protein n=1 Tax=Chara braunii TaxID=69332 RepID=A0A388M8D4_CHABU|nr:hypothetical protein CBR_g51259 [Chara braunii]|eukprot:GBG90753.1 hypothetical protein CBR_g51259 [Chara braunii]